MLHHGWPVFGGAARIKKIKQLRQRLAKTERYVNDKAACNITSKVII